MMTFLWIPALLIVVAALTVCVNALTVASRVKNGRGVLLQNVLLVALLGMNAFVPLWPVSLAVSLAIGVFAYRQLKTLTAGESSEAAKARYTATHPTLLLTAIAFAGLSLWSAPAWFPTVQKTTELVKAKDGTPAKLSQAIGGPYQGNPVAELEALPEGQVQVKAMFNEGAVNNQAPPRAVPRTDLQPLQTVTQTTLIGLGVGTLLLLVVFQGLLQKRGPARTETSVS